MEAPENNSALLDDPKEYASNLRAEYAELSRYFIEVVKFRFTMLGFFVAGQLAILVNSKSRLVFLLGALVTVAFAIVEIRTKILYRQIGERGINIEIKWGHRSNLPQERSYFKKMFSNDNEDISINILGRLVIIPNLYRGFVSHSFGIDLVYVAFFGADFILFLVGP